MTYNKIIPAVAAVATLVGCSKDPGHVQYSMDMPNGAHVKFYNPEANLGWDFWETYNNGNQFVYALDENGALERVDVLDNNNCKEIEGGDLCSFTEGKVFDTAALRLEAILNVRKQRREQASINIAERVNGKPF